MYPFMTLDDDTEITHSEKLSDGRVKVYIETPDEKDCFHHMTVYLPDYEKKDVFGYSEDQVNYLMQLIESEASLIIEFAADGGFKNARIGIDFGEKTY